MNQILALLLAGLLCLSTTACSKDVPNEDTGKPEEPPVVQTETDTAKISQPIPVEEPEMETVWEVPGTVKVSLLQTEYPVGAERMTVVFENTGDVRIGYGLDCYVDKFADGQWHRIEYVDGIAFASVLVNVEPHAVRTMEVGWYLRMLSETLDEGLYRVSGSKIWVGENGARHGDTDSWQVDFRITADTQPEPDFALYIPQPVSSMAEAMAVHFINNTGADAAVLLIPHLERQDENGEWQEVPWKDNVGFCGTFDPLPVEGRGWLEDVSRLWGRLEEGQYRLHYKVGRESDSEDRAEAVYGEFTVCAPEICGYPTAEQFLQSHPLED